MSPEEKARLKALIDDPPPGSKIEAAKEFGVDLYLNLRRLELSYEERFFDLQRAANFLIQMRESRHKAQ
jgi:hypothetical protein